MFVVKVLAVVKILVFVQKKLIKKETSSIGITTLNSFAMNAPLKSEPRPELPCCHITAPNKASDIFNVIHLFVFPSLEASSHGVCSICSETAPFPLIDRCAEHILNTCRYRRESNMLKGAREQTAVRLQQCFPRRLAVNEEDNKGGCLTRQCCCQTHDVCASRVWRNGLKLC